MASRPYPPSCSTRRLRLATWGAFSSLLLLAGSCQPVGMGQEQEEQESLPARWSEALDDRPPEPAAPPSSERAQSPSLPCPEGMMSVAGRFCVDQWESSLVDKSTGLRLSPYYPPDRHLALATVREWESQRLRLGDKTARQIPLPPLPEFQRQREVEPVSTSSPGVIPNAYLSGLMAERACKNAGKRLCRHDEWMLACGGERRLRFPYGRAYRQGVCNIFRPLHPAIVLHANPILGHHDPRLDLVEEDNGDPLLRPTGATPGCKSEWDGKAAWDMNGNLDEWVADARGRLAGGFFSRARKEGCDATILEHPKAYYDYSTGARCCWSKEPSRATPR